MTDAQAPEKAGALPRSTPLARYGPITAVIVAIALVAVLASTGTSQNRSTAARTTADPTKNPDLPISYAQAKAAGTIGNYKWPDNCDPKTGRLKIPSIYAPPCLAAVNNHGVGQATWQGVTATTIKVVYYIPPPNAGVTSMMAAFEDPEAVQEKTVADFQNMFEHINQMWGRKIELVKFKATGGDDDVEAARADALKVANDIKPFASLGGPALTPAYADVLAKNKILCIGCGLSVPDSYFQQDAPYMWGTLATPEQYLNNVGDYVVNRLLNKKASFAGPELKDKIRKFGVIHFEQDPPVFGSVAKEVARQGKERGWEAPVNETYILDPPKLPERAATIIAKMKANGITSIIFLGDPLMPISLTKEATKQNYFPEWIVTGTVLTDTTTLGRVYDQAQWAHAFGISSLPARLPFDQLEPNRIHEWYYGRPPAAIKTSTVIFQNANILFLGVDMAGPNLNPLTFEGGMFSYPPTGGGPTSLHISFGHHGYFKDPDFLAVDDVTEIWWDANATGKSEQGIEGKGMWRYADGGKRYLPGHMPPGPSLAGVVQGSVTVYDKPPPGDAPPSYPSPNKGG